MNPWEVWDSPLFGGHPCVIVSNAKRVERKHKVVVLKCTTLRPGIAYLPDELHTTLDQEDGLATTTRCECDLFYTVEKSASKKQARRGFFRTPERHFAQNHTKPGHRRVVKALMAMWHHETLLANSSALEELGCRFKLLWR